MFETPQNFIFFFFLYLRVQNFILESSQIFICDTLEDFVFENSQNPLIP